jgi:hypothetical protein
MSGIEIYAIENYPLLNILDTLIKDHVITRTGAKKSTASCRQWQLTYILLCLYAKNNDNFIQLISDYYNNCIYQQTHTCQLANNNLITHINYIKHAIDYITTYENPYENPLYNIIVRNMFVPDYISPVNNINSLLFSNEKKFTNYCLCIYIDPTSGVNFGNILHYFTLIYDTMNEPPRWYLNSSYGSDFVCIPQQTQELNIEQFNLFCQGYNSNPELYEEFIKTYFLPNGITTWWSKDVYEEDPSLRFKPIDPSQGIVHETNVYTQNMYNSYFRVGYIPEYENLCLSVLQSRPTGGNHSNLIKKKRKCKTHKKRKCKTHKKCKCKTHKKRKTRRGRK